VKPSAPQGEAFCNGGRKGIPDMTGALEAANKLKQKGLI
jgi:hypothetical protein